MIHKSLSTLSHKDKKNPKSQEEYQKRRHEVNAMRGKQSFNPELKTWSR